MERRYYTAETLEAELRVFEERYGMSSDVHAHARAEDDVPPDVCRFDSLVWADTYHTRRRMLGRD